MGLPGYGIFPSENSSQRRTPKDHTSDCAVKIRSVKDSNAIHLTGRASYNMIP